MYVYIYIYIYHVVYILYVCRCTTTGVHHFRWQIVEANLIWHFVFCFICFVVSSKITLSIIETTTSLPHSPNMLITVLFNF